jgi:putative ABC transport system permease protein
MILSYICLAIRNLLKQRLYAFINIFGLAAGLTAALFVLLFILNELSWDKYHKNGNRIYRVIEHNYIHQWVMASTPFPLADAIVAESPDVAKASHVCRIHRASIEKDRQWITEEDLYSAGPGLFDIFTFPILKGDIAALNEPHTAIMAESIAKKYFGEDDPMEQMLKIRVGDTVHMLRVAGIMDDPPRNITLRPGIVTSADFGLDAMSKSLITSGGAPPGPSELRTGWDYPFFDTYLLLESTADTNRINRVFHSLEIQYFGEEPMYAFDLQPLNDIYLGSGSMVNSDYSSGNRQTIYIFSGIGLLIIIISALNYILLYSGQTVLRSQEYGVRKVFGASRSDLLKQSITESSVMILIVLPLALILVELFRPEVSQYLGKNLIIESRLSWQYPIGFILIAMLVGLVPGVTIISYISRIRPVVAIGSLKIHQRGQSLLRMVLVFIQFLIFNLLLICSLGIFKQIHYSVHKDIGFQWQHLLTVKLDQNSFAGHFNVIKDKLSEIPDIISISGGMFLPPSNSRMSFHTKKLDGSDDEVNIEALFVDPDYLETMGLQLIEGRSLSDFDQFDTWKIVLNQKALEVMGGENPVGEKIWMGDVVGIIKDFNVHSLHEEIPPMMIIASMDNLRQMVILCEENTESDLRDQIVGTIGEIMPGSNPEITYMEDVIKELYKEERKTASIVALFTIIAVCIGAMGLFGMSMYILQRRRREFAIRKVNGAQMYHIMISLAGNHLILIISALVIASPIAILLLNRWLQNFVFKTSISWWIFAMTGGITVMIVIVTVGYHIIRAAMTNPVVSLRYE